MSDLSFIRPRRTRQAEFTPSSSSSPFAFLCLPFSLIFFLSSFLFFLSLFFLPFHLFCQLSSLSDERFELRSALQDAKARIHDLAAAVQEEKEKMEGMQSTIEKQQEQLGRLVSEPRGKRQQKEEAGDDDGDEGRTRMVEKGKRRWRKCKTRSTRRTTLTIGE